MPRLVGVDIPANKRLIISLTYIYGIGPAKSNEIVTKLKLDPSIRAKDLSSDQVAKLNSLIVKEYMTEGDLRRKIKNDIQRLISIHSYRGLRHRTGLPVRGQQTQTNARTRKGKSKSIAGKKRPK